MGNGPAGLLLARLSWREETEKKADRGRNLGEH